MRITDIVLAEGSFQDILSANNALDDYESCVEICVLLGVQMSDAEEYFEIIQSVESSRCVPSSRRDYGRELVEDALMDKVETTCLKALCELANSRTLSYSPLKPGLLLYPLETLSYRQIVMLLESGDLCNEDIPANMWNELGVALAEIAAERKIDGVY